MLDATTTTPITLAECLPSVDRAWAQWSRVLHDTRLPSLLRRSGLGVELLPVQAAPTGRVFALELSCDNAAFNVEMAHARHPSMAMATAPSVQAPVRRLAAQTLFGAAAGGLHRLGLGEWLVSDLSAHVEPQRVAAASPWVDVHRDGARVATLRVVQAPAALRESVVERLRSGRTETARRSAWAIGARVVLHRQAYGVDLLSSLATGDVMLLAPPAASLARMPVTLQWGMPGGLCLAAAATIEAGVLKIQGAPVMQEESDEQEAPADDTSAPDVLGQLDIPVRFEIDTVTMALSDIESIGPGYVIELATPLHAAAIRLVAFGQVIGHAELVAVGEQLGARITRMVAR
jgi:type III secretion protein Q